MLSFAVLTDAYPVLCRFHPVQQLSSGATGSFWTTSCSLPSSKQCSSGLMHRQLHPCSRPQHQRQPSSSSRRRRAFSTAHPLRAATAHLSAAPPALHSAQQPRRNQSSAYETHLLSTHPRPLSHHRLKGSRQRAQPLLALAAERGPWQHCWAARQQLPAGSRQQQQIPARHLSSTEQVQGWQGLLQRPSTAAASPQHSPQQLQGRLDFR